MKRIPILVRAIVFGLIVQVIGVMPFMALIQLNLEILPAVPWSAFVEWVLLILFIKYFNGWGWPASTRETRRAYFRANRTPDGSGKGVVLVSALIGVTVMLLVILGYRFVSFPSEAIGVFLQIADGPPIAGLTILATGAAMTGVVEEVAFRGYMQVPLENKYGASVGIGVVAVIFALVHFPPLPILPLFLLGAVGWGLLAHSTNSTIPGMIVHGLVDFAFFLWIFLDSDAVLSLLESSILESGPDAIFLVVSGLTLVVGVSAVAAIRRVTGS